MLESSVRGLLEGVDLSVAEVSHQEITAEPPEVRRSEREPPRRVELSMLRDPARRRPGGADAPAQPLPSPCGPLAAARSFFALRTQIPQPRAWVPDGAYAERAARPE